MPSGPSTSTNSGLRLSVAPSASHKDIFVVRVDGSVDTVTADELDSVIGSLVRQRRTRLVIDLAGAHYISSAGWGIFISRLREVREDGGDLKLARMTSSVRDVYDLLELDGVLRHFDLLDTAESHFNGGKAQERAAVKPNRAVHPPAPATAPPPVAASSLEDALRQLIVEDPFYSLKELQGRLAEIGFPRTSRWTTWRALWSMRLALKSQRFRYYRRQMHGTTR